MISLPKLKYQGGKKKMYSFRISSPLLNAIKKYAARNGYSDAKVIRMALDLFLQAQNERK